MFNLYYNFLPPNTISMLQFKIKTVALQEVLNTLQFNVLTVIKTVALQEVLVTLQFNVTI